MMQHSCVDVDIGDNPGPPHIGVASGVSRTGDVCIQISKIPQA